MEKVFLIWQDHDGINREEFAGPHALTDLTLRLATLRMDYGPGGRMGNGTGYGFGVIAVIRGQEIEAP